MIVYCNAPTVSEALPVILRDLLEEGQENGSRNGRVKELLNPQIVITDPTRREVICPGRKANVFAQIAETLWVLSGRNDVEWLSAYLPRATDYSDDGETWRGGYGPRIRRWQLFNGDILDQLEHVVDLLSTDPLSRRAVIGIYDPAVDTEPGKDIPCNDFLQFQSRNGALHLTVTVRSNDAMWGWSGINAFEWSTLQEVVASLLGIQVGELVFNIGSLHVYQQHWNKAQAIVSQAETPSQIATIPFNSGRRIRTLPDFDNALSRWFAWEESCRSGGFEMGLFSRIEDPLLKAWAAAIAFFWTQDQAWVPHFRGTALAVAVARTPASVYPEPVVPRTASHSAPVAAGSATIVNEPVRAFYDFVTRLHAEKHASYGDSWKKRGEIMSILPNMARKVDRLGVGDSYDTSADTVIDLMVYAAKYLCWLGGGDDGPDGVNPVLEANLRSVLPGDGDWDTEWAVSIPKSFDAFVDDIPNSVEEKIQFAADLVRRLAPIAFDLWYAEDEYKGADFD